MICASELLLQKTRTKIFLLLVDLVPASISRVHAIHSTTSYNPILWQAGTCIGCMFALSSQYRNYILSRAGSLNQLLRHEQQNLPNLLASQIAGAAEAIW